MSDQPKPTLSQRYELGPLGMCLSALCFAFSVLLFLSGIAVAVELFVNGIVVSALFLFPFWLAAYKVRRLGARLGARNVESLLQIDQRPPVLYLRSFDSDQRIVTPKRPVIKMPFIGEIDAKFFPGIFFQMLMARALRPRRIEEQNAALLRLLGPVVTVAKPGEKIPQLGASRISFANGDWQSRVTELMQKAQLIVMQSGGSRGLRWELGQAFSLKPFKPLLICAPPTYEESVTTRQDQYGIFKRALLAEVPRIGAMMPDQVGNVTHFFFPTPDRFEEYETQEGPPMMVLDQMRPGTSQKFQAQLKRMKIIFFSILAVVTLTVIYFGLRQFFDSADIY